MIMVQAQNVFLTLTAKVLEFNFFEDKWRKLE